MARQRCISGLDADKVRAVCRAASSLFNDDFDENAVRERGATEDVDDAIAQLRTSEGRITHLPTTRSGQVIDCVITVKANKSAANGLVATAVPNVWATPKRSS